MITSWIILLETIRVAAHVLEVLFGFPAEESLGFGRIGIVFRDVAGTAGSNDIRNSDVIDAGIGINQIQDGIAVAGTKIDDFRAGMGSGIIAGLHMAIGQVNHMDIIPDAGAIRSGIIIAENGELFQLAYGHLGDIGNKVVGNAGGILANEAGLMSADGVEITKKDNAPLRISRNLALQDFFNHVFGPAIGIGAAQGNHILTVRHFRLIAVYGGRRREDETLDTMGLHGFTQGQGRIQVVAVITQGLGNAFTNRLQAGEVNNAVEVVLAENTIHGCLISHVCLIMRNRMADDLFDPVDGFRTAVDIIVHNDRFMTRVAQFNTGMGSDKTGAAGQQYFHSVLLLR